MKRRSRHRILHFIFVRVGVTYMVAAVLTAFLLVPPLFTATTDTAFRPEACRTSLTIVTRPSLPSGYRADDQLERWVCDTELLTVSRSADVNTASSSFSLSFLEFREDGSLAAPSQLQSLKQLIAEDDAAGEKTYLITYVPGWRNNAARGNDDVRKFTVLLSYVAPFLAQRCEKRQKQYCRMNVRGLYVGWRGATFREWGDSGLDLAIVAPTFLGRKIVSGGRLAVGIGTELRQIESWLTLRKAAGPEAPDRMLVTGHSLGGNVLFRAFRDGIAATLDDPGRSSIVDPPVGDLLVLVNPATSAAEWNSTVRRRPAGLPPDASQYALGQPPAVLALTDTCPFNKDPHLGRLAYWLDFVRTFRLQLEATERAEKDNDNFGLATEDIRPNCDWVTSFAFPLAQIALMQPEKERRTAMGQLVPATEVEKDIHLGVSHNAVTDNSAGFRTTFASSIHTVANRCDGVPNWLEGATYARGWEVKVPTGNGASLTLKQGTRMFTSAKVRPNWPSGLLIKTGAITEPNDPFWNAATHSNTISNHGGFVSYVLWCAINKLVLDDPMNRW